MKKFKQPGNISGLDPAPYISPRILHAIYGKPNLSAAASIRIRDAIIKLAQRNIHRPLHQTLNELSMTPEQNKADILAAKICDAMRHHHVPLSPTGQQIQDALNEAGLQIIEKEPKKEKTLFDYIYEYLKAKHDGIEIRRVCRMDAALYGDAYIKQRNENIIQRLTFEQCCGILKMICEEKFNISFDQFIKAYKSTDMTYKMKAVKIGIFVEKEFLDKIFKS